MTDAASVIRATAMALAVAAVCAGASGCGNTPPPPPSAQVSEPPALLQAGTLAISASTVQTASLGEATARQYGIKRAPGSALLLVGLRDGPAETPVTGRVTATVGDLFGRRRSVALREVRSGAFVDYVGTFAVSPPETLAFEVQIETADGPRASLRFNRDFGAR